ncbi:F0F1 ATP synthase subunit epsilon [Rhodothermus profundi]|uniref:ATP synthase epsilon chain n=1 Tax=Rhodothermus profundi TaxID=633813 RepID=A0A1M6RJ31_9BACT|nr:F0F1 ATP synthase subunit epsilon [Rhodothermus profundi]SHK32439.1 ATP synthase F1 subcomplex epsilon subunit [Rhodothermus profundi]
MARTLFVEIVAPDRRVFRGEALSVRAPGVEGSFEVRYNHAPMVAAITVGPLFVTTPAGERITFATSGGFVEVLGNTVTILAETAEPASEIDVERARAAEQRALERLQKAQTPEERAEAEAALERARNRLRVAMGQVGQRIRP